MRVAGVFLLLLLARFAVGCPSCGGAEVAIGNRPDYYLGNTDRFGHFAVWFKLATVQLSHGAKLPVYVSYNAGDRRSDTIFGAGWHCPSLESRILPVSERHLALTLLGGQTVNLYRRGGAEEYASYDTLWRGRDTGGGRIEVLGPGKSHFRYKDGRIQSVKIKDDNLEWSYAGEETAAIFRNGKPLIELVRGPGETKPGVLRIDGKDFQLQYQKLPLFASLHGIPTVVEFSQVLSRITSAEKTLDLPIIAQEDGTVEMEIADSLSPKSRKYQWDGITGLLESDEKWTYSVEASRVKDRFIVQRTDSKGVLESYESTPVFTRHILPSGGAKVRRFIKLPGVGYGKLRSESIIDKAGKVVAETKWAYDEKWNLIRRTSGQEMLEWFRSDEGDLIRETRKFAGNLVREIKYDDQGRIASRMDGKDLFEYSYDDGGKVVKRFIDGTLRFTLVEDADGKKTFFSPTAAIETIESVKGLSPDVGVPHPGQIIKEITGKPIRLPSL